MYKRNKHEGQGVVFLPNLQITSIMSKICVFFFFFLSKLLMFIHEKAGAHPSAVTKKRLLSGPLPFDGSKEMTGLKVTAGENHSIRHGVVCR